MIETGAIIQHIERIDLDTFNCCTEEAKKKLIEFCQQVPVQIDRFLSDIRRLLASDRDKKQVTKEDIISIAMQIMPKALIFQQQDKA